jgi:hypothetical protein
LTTLAIAAVNGTGPLLGATLAGVPSTGQFNDQTNEITFFGQVGEIPENGWSFTGYAWEEEVS